MKKLFVPTTLAAVLMTFSGALHAQIIDLPVPNFSFEDDAPFADYYGDVATGMLPITDWTVNTFNYYGVQTVSSVTTNPGTSQGNNYAFFNLFSGQTASLTSQTVAQITDDTTYTLTVAIANEIGNGDYQNPGNTFIELIGFDSNNLQLSSPLAYLSIPDGTIADGTFQDFSVNFTTGDNDPMDGYTFKIEIGATGTGNDQPGFDNVRLTAGPAVAPEPSTWALMLGGMGFLVLLARRKLFQA